MQYDVQIQRVERQPVAVVRRRAGVSELSRVVPQACGEVWNALKALQVQGAGRHVAIYLDNVINLEIGAEVPAEFEGKGEIICSAIPAGEVATAAHFGPYNRLGDAYCAIRQWCADHSRTLAGPNWEIYGHWPDDPAQVRTDVFYLLKS